MSLSNFPDGSANVLKGGVCHSLDFVGINPDMYDLSIYFKLDFIGSVRLLI
jgi:hypothetical protein